MSTSARNAVSIFVAATAAVAWGILNASPVAAEPGDSGVANPGVGDVPALPLMRAVDPVMARVDSTWHEFVPPNADVPWSPLAAFQQFVEPFIPTTTQVGDFGRFIQQWRSPAVTPPAG